MNTLGTIEHRSTTALRARDDESDAALVHRTAEVIARPRLEPADSFVLHAPLELLARTALLPHVSPVHRVAARERIAEIGTTYAAFGDAVDPPSRVDPPCTRTAAARLVAAIARGELDDVDALADWLGRHAAAHELPSLLADAVLPLLGAAGHAPIFLWLYPRVAPRREATPAMLRPLCRELARRPDWRLHWIDDDRPFAPGGAEPTDELFQSLARTPLLGAPESAFIHPLMSRVDRPDRAGTLRPLTGGGPIEARVRALLRVAAWSMLDEPGEHAPYGWSHCLTMPQAVAGVAHAVTDPSQALAIAASHVYGFRASLASRTLDTGRAASWRDECRDTCGDGSNRERAELGADAIGAALTVGPATARAMAWHLPSASMGDLRTTVATVAAVHHDAHLAKYVLACLDAAASDPQGERLYLTAAATLCGWWSGRPAGAEAG